MPLECSQPLQFKTEAVELTEATHLQVKDLDPTDSAEITTQSYVEKYSVIIKPSAWMKSYCKRATLIVEYLIKTDPATGTVSVQTLVGGVDAVEKVGINIASGKQTAVHTDILDFSSDFTISLEAKNSAADQTSLIDYCNIYLQIGTKSVSIVEVARITGIKSLSFDFSYIECMVWTGTTATATFRAYKDVVGDSAYLIDQTGSIMYLGKNELKAEFMLESINEYLSLHFKTDDATNPTIFKSISYNRVWFE